MSLKRGKSSLSIFYENRPKVTMTFYRIFARKDKCQVSKDNHEDQENEIFLREDNLTQGHKRKSQTDLRGVYKEREGERRNVMFL